VEGYVYRLEPREVKIGATFLFDAEQHNPRQQLEFFANQPEMLEFLKTASHGQVMLALFRESFPRLPEGSVLLLDEPEMALSVSNQRRILKMLLELVDQKHFRIVCATHSPVLIDAPETYVIDLDRHINRNVATTDMGLRAPAPFSNHAQVEDRTHAGFRLASGARDLPRGDFDGRRHVRDRRSRVGRLGRRASTPLPVGGARWRGRRWLGGAESRFPEGGLCRSGRSLGLCGGDVPWTGLGRNPLAALAAESESHGIWTLQAGIFPENRASIALHERLGFRHVGARERIGQRDGRWRDTVLMERRSEVTGI